VGNSGTGKNHLTNNEVEKHYKLARYLEKKQKPTFSSFEISHKINRQNIQLSFGQQRLWFLHKLTPENPVYNRPTILRIHGNLNASTLEDSINFILERHEILRTVFPEQAGKPKQIIQSTQKIPLAIEVLPNFPESEKMEKAFSLMIEIVNRPFDLAKGPLVRLHLYKIKDNDYILLFVTHHILFDAWSETIFINELGVIYEALENNTLHRSADLPIQYQDFSFWQRNRMEGEHMQNQLKYWKAQLKDPPVLEMPLDKNRPSVLTNSGKTISFSLSEDVTRRIKQFCIDEKVTLYTVLLTSFMILLHRYSGQEDIILGSPVAGRGLLVTEELIGLFINTLVIRTSITSNKTIRNVLNAVRKTVYEALSNQDIPFEKIIEELQPERDPDRHPLFQILFNFENVPQPNFRMHDLALSRLKIPTKISNYELSLGITEHNNEIEFNFEYNTNLFNNETIVRLIRHYKKIIETFIIAPDVNIYQIPLLSHDERQRILVHWNDTKESYPRCNSIHELIEKQVLKTPDNIAVLALDNNSQSENDQVLTYWELNKRANQLARYLISLGIRPDDIVGICVERSINMIIGILGILKAGGGYLPLDPNYPMERVTFMLKDVQAKILLTQESLKYLFFLSDLHQVCLDSEWDKIALGETQNLIPSSSPRNIAYVIYSSGSTGLPKGIIIEHASLINYTLFRNVRFKVDEAAGMLQFASLSFDLSVAEIFPCLTRGARLVLRTDEMVNSVPLFFEICKKYKISHMKLTTSFWHEICNSLEFGLLEIPKNVKWISVAGDRLKIEDVLPWQNTAGDSPNLVNEYGPTETTGTSSIHQFSKKESIIISPPIGRPNKNEQLYILDQHLTPVPIGVIGELYIGGNGLARGYLNRQGLTAENFIPNPFSNQPGSRFYKSGDLARFLPDGNIEFIGRSDHQVKIRGFRVELGEIETALINHHKIQSAVALAHDHPSSHKYLVGYVIPVREEVPTDTELRTFLKLSLPDFMVPSRYIIMDSFPLTSSGKINRLGFPKPDSSYLVIKNQNIKPRTSIEKFLHEIWTELLNVDNIGVFDNFFELGGHSLLITLVVSRINQIVQAPFSIRTFFDSPTIADLAFTIENQILSDLESHSKE